MQIYIGLAGLAFTAYTFFKAKDLVDDVGDKTQELGSSIGLGLYDAKETFMSWFGVPTSSEIATRPAQTTTQQRADELYNELYRPYQNPYESVLTSDADRLKAKREQLKAMGLL